MRGHMQCVVDNGQVASRSGDAEESNITFLYTLGRGVCPKSFGINVAKMAGLPDDVLVTAKRISAEFERQMNGDDSGRKTLTARTASDLKEKVLENLEQSEWEKLEMLWRSLRES